MRKMLLVGKLNKTLQATNAELIKSFSVQITIDNPDMVRGMMKIHNPDVVVVMLNGVAPENSAVFDEILMRQYNCPLVAVGTIEEYEEHAFSLNNEKVQYIEAPVSDAELYVACCKLFNDTTEAEVEAIAAPQTEVTDTRKTILLVDDSAMMLRTVKRLLEDTYNVVLATSGAQAMAAIGRKKPDMVLLDYDMPVCDGKMTLEMIRADEGMKDLPVVFLTGKQSKDNIMSVLDLKPAGYLIKPTTRELLLGTIEKIVGK